MAGSFDQITYNSDQMAGSFDQIACNSDQMKIDSDQNSGSSDQMAGNSHQKSDISDQMAFCSDQRADNFDQMADNNSDQMAGSFDRREDNFDQMADNSDQMAGSFDQMTRFSDQMAGCSDQMTANSDQMEGNSDLTARSSDLMADNSDQMAGSSDQMAGCSDHRGDNSACGNNQKKKRILFRHLQTPIQRDKDMYKVFFQPLSNIQDKWAKKTKRNIPPKNSGKVAKKTDKPYKALISKVIDYFLTDIQSHYPDSELSSKAKAGMKECGVYFADRILSEAERLAEHNGRSIITLREVIGAVENLGPSEWTDNMVSLMKSKPETSEVHRTNLNKIFHDFGCYYLVL